jgi:hypothetical protein
MGMHHVSGALAGRPDLLELQIFRNGDRRTTFPWSPTGGALVSN